MLAKKRKLKISRKHWIIIISAFLIFVAVSLLIFKYYKLNENAKNDEENKELFFEEISQTEKEQETNVEEIKNEQSASTYVAVLEIPEIDLTRGLVDKDSEENDVDKNIYVLKESIFPNEEQESHIILASHSGSSEVSFFKNLNKLEMKDSVFLYYEGIKYIYEITNIYEIEKSGTVSLRQTEESDITLITCVRGTDDKQVVYIATLIDEQDY